MTEPTPAPDLPAFEPDSPHHQKPRLRAVRTFPAKVGDQTLMGLADASQISEHVIAAPPKIQPILALMNGDRTIDQIVTEVGRGLQRPVVENLVAQLDQAGLLFGPRFDALLADMQREYDALDVLPPGATAGFTEALVTQTLGLESGQKPTEEQIASLGPARLREVFDAWMSEALKGVERPSFDALPRAIVAPHIDYPRGWMNYAHAWGRMRVVDRPDRVVILGANHFGRSTGIAACDKGFQTPLGVSPLDTELADHMRRRLGDELFEHRYDHEREHSIELQIPWIQHCLGPAGEGEHCKVFAALVHDPAVNNGEPYDGQGVALKPFVDALRESLASLGGQTLIVASADFSHVGPMFGDPQPLAGDSPEAEKARNKVLNHDREMITLITENKPWELIGAMAWQQNPTRWCSTGSLVATMLTIEPEEITLLNYGAAMDQQGMGIVSTAALVMR